MSFRLYVDESRWRAHLRTVLDTTPGLVPVIKGNGYGLGIARLAAEAAVLGVDTVAVGAAREVEDVRRSLSGDVLVMEPATAETTDEAAVIRTVSHLDVLSRLAADTRIVLECRTSMNRHGIEAGEAAVAVRLAEDHRLAGYAFHLPIDRHGGYDPVAEIVEWQQRLTAAGAEIATAWVSHLTPADLRALRSRFPTTTYRPRIGTSLWLGERSVFEARGTVVDVHRLAAGDHLGYRRRRVTRPASVVVVSGGTAHGIALEAPRAVRGPTGRLKELAAGSLAASNRALSPFHWAGRQRWFAEPPHMQVSMLLLPASVAPPAIGEELRADVRMTTLHPDEVVSR